MSRVKLNTFNFHKGIFLNYTLISVLFFLHRPEM